MQRRMVLALLALLALTMVTCGSEDDDDDDDDYTWVPSTGGTVGTGGVSGDLGTGGEATGGTPAPPPSECVSHTISDASALNKLKAARCFGLHYSESFTCSHSDLSDATSCTGSVWKYSVPWGGRDTAQALDSATGNVVGQITLNPDGTAAMIWIDGKTGTCTIDGATLTLCTVV